MINEENFLFGTFLYQGKDDCGPVAPSKWVREIQMITMDQT